jgi:protein-S-isoprenylcysteine O-methyltransferase Ste14
MMGDMIVDELVEASKRPRSARFKAAAMALLGIGFVVVVPALLFLLARWLEQRLPAPNWRTVESGFAMVAMILGLGLAAWTALTLVLVGKGTPAPVAPPPKLIVTGPYRFCRNPMVLGALTYYLGIGTRFGSLEIGVLMFLVMMILGSCYLKLVEEKELEERFGKEYEEYREKTPFLRPKWPR